MINLRSTALVAGACVVAAIVVVEVARTAHAHSPGPASATISDAGTGGAPTRVPTTVTPLEASAAADAFYASPLVRALAATASGKPAHFTIKDEDDAVWIDGTGARVGVVVTARSSARVDVPAGTPNIRETTDTAQAWTTEQQPTTVTGATGVIAYIDVNAATVVAVAPLADNDTVYPPDPPWYTPAPGDD